MIMKIEEMEYCYTVEDDEDGLYLINIPQYITFQKYGSNKSMLELL